MTSLTRPSILRSPLALWLLVLVMALLGVVGGVLIEVAQTPPDRPWERWASPPERITKIVAAYGSDVYLTTTSGALYACDQYDCRSITTEEVQPLPGRCDQHLFEPPTAPGEVIAALELCLTGAETPTQENMIALSDGSLWTWYKWSPPWGERLFEVLYGAIGGGLGLAIGVIVAVVARGRTRRSTVPAIRPVQILGRLCLIAGIGIALVLISFGTGVDFGFYLPLGVASLVALGIVLLALNKRSAEK